MTLAAEVITSSAPAAAATSRAAIGTAMLLLGGSGTRRTYCRPAGRPAFIPYIPPGDSPFSSAAASPGARPGRQAEPMGERLGCRPADQFAGHVPAFCPGAFDRIPAVAAAHRGRPGAQHGADAVPP